MSSNCSLVTGPGMSSSSICAESCGRAALPLAAAVLRLRGMKTPLVQCYASHTKFLTGSFNFYLCGLDSVLRRTIAYYAPMLTVDMSIDVIDQIDETIRL